MYLDNAHIKIESKPKQIYIPKIINKTMFCLKNIDLKGS